MKDQFDETIHKFFKKYNKEVADNGFSDKVIQKLPYLPKNMWILYSAYVIGILVFVFIGSYKWLITQIYLFLLSSCSLQIPSLVSLLSFLSIGFFIWLFVKISFDESFI